VKVTVSLTVQRDDGTVLTRSEQVGNDQRWVQNKQRRLTRVELRKSLDARIAAALNSMGVR
jgi:hypothetical protein